MKKQTFVSIMITASILFTASCSKEDTSTGGGSSSGTNNCSSNYLPYRVGTKVESKDASGNSSSFTVKKDTTINGILYYEIQNSGTPSTVRSFMGIDNSKNVWIKTSGGDPLGGGAFSVATEYIMLNPSKAVGDTWSYKTSMSLSGFTMDYIFNMKILEKNISATVDGKSYSNGIRFSMENKVAMLGSTTSSSTLEYVFLCGLGIYTSKQNGQIMSTTTKYTY
jgi:hypothetical protein